jgi:leader peptidase (prepilin peptidase)/N-methyltransferase
MELGLALFALAPGLALGSFLNVVAARLPRRQSLVRPRSACHSCGAEIGWRDNVPLVSYALLGGRCRNCRESIGFMYPAVELTTALLFAGCFLAFGLSLRALVAAAFCAALVVVTATDLEHRIIPNWVVGPVSVLVLLGQTIDRPSPEWAIAAVGASTFLLLAALAYPGGMGMGDVKLAFLMGAALGRDVAAALMIGMVAALLPSIVLLARHGAKARKMGIPFGPFLALGSVVALFAGSALVHAYTSLY